MNMNFRDIIGSLWIIVAFIPIIGFIGFIWIGIKAREREWLKIGVIYSLLCFLLPFGTATLNLIGVLQSSTVTGAFLGTAIVSTLCSYIHALALRQPYLDKMAERRGDDDIFVG
ncbi:MAG: hypothetical protein LBK56_05735 [Gracilibacteraceae bacterium]|nr:hypothetical protein [Gracilibacteraceae bacterium]